MNRLDLALARAERAATARADKPEVPPDRPGDAAIRQALSELDALIAQLKKEEADG